MMQVPPLNHWCNSWVVSRLNGEVAFETWDRSVVERLNPEKCIVENAYDYLCRINREIAARDALSTGPQ